MILVMEHIVTRLADLKIKLVVGADGDELPAVRLVLREICVNHRRLLRLVELVLDVFDLRNLRQLGDVKCAILEGETIGAIETFGHSLDLGLAILLDHRGNLVAEPGADKESAWIRSRGAPVKAFAKSSTIAAMLASPVQRFKISTATVSALNTRSGASSSQPPCDSLSARRRSLCVSPPRRGSFGRALSATSVILEPARTHPAAHARAIHKHNEARR